MFQLSEELWMLSVVEAGIVRPFSKAEFRPEADVPGGVYSRIPRIQVSISAPDVENVGVQRANIIVVSYVLSFRANLEPGAFQMGPGCWNILFHGNIPDGRSRVGVAVASDLERSDLGPPEGH